MTEQTGGEAAVAEATDVNEAPVRDVEAAAREQGWRPKEEWTGKPENWKDAKTYVEWGDHGTRLSRIEDRIEKEVAARVSKIEKINATTIDRLTKIHEAELASLRAQKKDAIKAGNADLVERIDAEIDKRRDEAPLTDDPKAKKAEAEKAFGEANPWYGSNRKMTAFARGLSNDLATTASEAGKELSYDDNIRQVLVAVREEFPEYFEKAANGHAAVDGGSENGPAPKTSSPLAKLSAVERNKAKEDMKKYPKAYPTEQSWVDALNS